jgi:predicted RNA-binding protein YlxR (DUF448 family)
MPNRKHLNRAKYVKYRTEGRREKNKLRKLHKIAKKQPNNTQIKKQIKNLLQEKT